MLVPSTIGNLLLQMEECLSERAGSSARLEARILLEHVLDLDRAQLLSRSQTMIAEDVIVQLQPLLLRRLNGEPVFRILGEREFYGRSFLLNEATLEPRADTETLIDAVLNRQDQLPSESCFLDLGSGTGCISITLLAEMPQWNAIASDISEKAIKAVTQNSQRHRVQDRLGLLVSDGFDAIERQFDFIVSNPPYIASDDINSLSVEVRNHDPLAALDGGKSGFDFYEMIFSQAYDYLSPKGLLFLEFGIGQGPDLYQIANRHNWQVLEILPDLAQIDRVLIAGRSI